jgi:hypothetical protein
MVRFAWPGASRAGAIGGGVKPCCPAVTTGAGSEDAPRDKREVANAPRFAIFEDLEIRGFQIGDMIPFSIGDNHVQLDQVHVHACERLLRQARRASKK